MHLVREPRQFRDDIVQRRPSGGSGRASPRSSPARRAAARRRLCSCGTPTASRTAPCATGTRPTAGASSRRSGGGRAEAWGIRACLGIFPRRESDLFDLHMYSFFLLSHTRDDN